MGKSITLTFNSHIPAKKNSRRHVYVRGRLLVVPSEAHKAWRALELPTLQGLKGFDGAVRIKYDFYPGSLRLFDLSNTIESINDLLVEACIIADDNWLVVREMQPRLAGFDRDNERCVVTIEELPYTAFDGAMEVLRDKDKLKAVAKAKGITQKATKAEYEQIAREAAA